MGAWADTFVASVVGALPASAVAAEAAPMAAYMRHQFPFLGVRAPGQEAAVKVALSAAGPPSDEHEVVAAIDALWAQTEREHRYAGCRLAGRFAAQASPGFVDATARWITTDPWWDTCDPLARPCVGRIVRRNHQLRPTMDRWLDGDDLWLVRCAILHMGGWKHDIDRNWVFAACLRGAEDTDFFVRKAIGWILRDVARFGPDAVVAFVEGPGSQVLADLSKREALRSLRRTG